MEETNKEQLNRRYTALDLERSTWLPHYKDVSEFILPRRGRYLWSDVNQGSKKRFNSIIDNTGTIAARNLSSGLMTGVTSPARPWFELSPEDPEMKDYGPVKEWLFAVMRILYNSFSKSNIYNILPYGYLELGSFGTGAIGLFEDDKDVMRAYAYTVGSYMLGTNDRMSVDTVYREIPMTVLQVAQKFGIDAMSVTLRNMYDNKNYDKWVPIYHAVEPNMDHDPTLMDSKHKPFRSVYWEKGSDNDKLLRNSGFDEFPLMCPRWEVTGTDVYGTGPGMMCLGDIKQLQVQQRKKGIAIEKMVNPPMVGDVALKNEPLSTLPGGVTFVESNGSGKPGFSPAYKVDPKLGEMREDMRDVQERIKRAYFEDLFLMLANSDRREITAYEIAQRKEEKLLALGPVYQQLNEDLLDPLIDRAFAIHLRRGLLPPPPQELVGQDLKVEYISIMAQAQKAVGLSSIDRLAGFITNTAQVDPNVLDKANFDEMVDEYADSLGTPPKTVRTADQVAAIRNQRAQAQQQQMAMQKQALDVENAKKLSETDTSGDNALTQITGA